MEQKTNGQNTIIKSSFSTVISVISLIISIVSLIVTTQINYTANEIANHQAEISKNSTTPEFVYLGPAEKYDANDDGTMSYGLNPRFAKVSGYTNNISCNAFSRFKVKIGTKAERDIIFGPHVYSEYKEAYDNLKTITIDVKGEFIRDIISIDDSLIVVTLEETGSKITSEAITDRLEQYGYYAIEAENYCVGSIDYMNVDNEYVKTPFVIDMQLKAHTDFIEDQPEIEPIVVEYSWDEPNRGFSDDLFEDYALEIVKTLNGN